MCYMEGRGGIPSILLLTRKFHSQFSFAVDFLNLRVMSSVSRKHEMWLKGSCSPRGTKCLQQVSAHFWLFTIFQVTVILEGIGPQWSSEWPLALECISSIWAQERSYTPEDCHLGQLKIQSK